MHEEREFFRSLEPKMESGGLGHPTEAALLDDHRDEARLWMARRRNSVGSLHDKFVSRLPDKVRRGVDPESPDHIYTSRTKDLIDGEKDYHERQFATLRSFEEVDTLNMLSEVDQDKENVEQAQAEFVMKISNYVNVILMVLKVYVTIRNGSIAIAASTLDSLLDLMAGGILWFTHLSMKIINIYKYPIDKLRVQLVGIIIFAVIMATLGFQVFIQALEQLIKKEPTAAMSSVQLIWLYTIMLSATVVKLALWLYCRTLGNKIVRVYAKDHYSDVVTNVVGLAATILGDKFYWWIDPAGGHYSCNLYNFKLVWNLMGNAVSLVGQSAPPKMLQKLTYLVIRHDPQIKHVDTVRAYTFGVLYFVEVC